MSLPVLYCSTVNGRAQQWRIEVEGHRFRTEEGLVGGVLTTSAFTTCEGKNLGRKNATLPEEQAVKEAKAKWQKKLDSGYWEDIAKIHEPKFFEPVLAHKWEDYKDTYFTRTIIGFHSSPKLDGIRCIVRANGMWTRNGKPIVSSPHIRRAMDKIFDENPVLVFDGELYNHDLRHDFNKITSLVKRSKPTVEDLEESERLVQFHVFDVVNGPDGEDETFEERLARLRALSLAHQWDTMIQIVRYDYVRDLEQVAHFMAIYLEQGYEGQMLRLPEAPYEHKRSTALLKNKEFLDDEFEITDVQEGRGSREGAFGRFVLKTAAGIEFEAGSRGSTEYYSQLLKDREELIGQMATIRYQNLTPDGKPRFPVCVGIRDYE